MVVLAIAQWLRTSEGLDVLSEKVTISAFSASVRLVLRVIECGGKRRKERRGEETNRDETKSDRDGTAKNIGNSY